MKFGSTIILQATVALLAALTLFILGIIIPFYSEFERAGMYQPIIVGLYIAAIPFLFALYQAIKLLDNIDKSRAFSSASVRAFRYIKYSAGIICGLFAAGLPYIYIVADKDDAPGVLAAACVITIAAFVIAIFSGVMQKLFQTAVDIKSENELTV